MAPNLVYGWRWNNRGPIKCDMLFFRTNHMSIEVIGSSKYDAELDHLWGLALKTDDIEATHARLAESDVAVGCAKAASPAHAFARSNRIVWMCRPCLNQHLEADAANTRIVVNSRGAFEPVVTGITQPPLARGLRR